MRTTVFGIRIALAIAILLVAVPIAMGKGRPVERQQQCSANIAGGTPVVTSVKVGGVPVPLGSIETGQLPGAGKLFYSIEAPTSGSLNGSDCLLDWSLRLSRDYSGAQPQNGKWSEVWGVSPNFLDHGDLARKFNGAYADDPAVTADTPVEVVLTLPATGAYSAANAYWYTTTGKLDGNQGVRIDGDTVTITGRPAANLNAPNEWPNGLDPQFNAFTASPGSYALNNWPGGTPNGYDARATPPIKGAEVAPAASLGLQYGLSIRFSNGPLGKGSEEQRGSWFEAVNSPRWTTNFSGGGQGGSPSLQIGMGNYSKHFTSTQAEALVSGSLRMLLPDAWASLAFGVTSASDPSIIQGAIQVTRTEAGSTTPVAATTTPVAGSGIVVDVGTVTFSEPDYTTKRNTAVKAKRVGNKVRLTFRLTAKQAKGTAKITVFAGTKKVKKVATVKAKKGTNTVTVAYKKGNGYVIKLGKTVIGSAVVR